MTSNDVYLEKPLNVDSSNFSGIEYIRILNGKANKHPFGYGLVFKDLHEDHERHICLTYDAYKELILEMIRML